LLTELKITDFAAELGSSKPAPGGGSAAALAGVLASSLAAMVARLSGEGWQEFIDKAQRLSGQLLDLVNRDTEAFNQVMEALKLPKGTEEEKRERSRALRQANRLATEVPLEVMELSLEILRLAFEVALKGNRNCLSDAGVAGLLAAAACRGAAYNVLINLPGLRDAEFASAARARLDETLKEAMDLESTIADRVNCELA
jgi:formiminotetrahydrofolate cyclodeaminase